MLGKGTNGTWEQIEDKRLMLETRDKWGQIGDMGKCEETWGHVRRNGDM